MTLPHHVDAGWWRVGWWGALWLVSAVTSALVPGSRRWGWLLVTLRYGRSPSVLGLRLGGWIGLRLRHWGGGAVAAHVPLSVALEALHRPRAGVRVCPAWGHDLAALRTLSGAYPAELLVLLHYVDAHRLRS